MRRNMIAASVFVLAISIATAGAAPGTRGQGGPPSTRILNQVIGLLDTEVVLQSETDEDAWESSIFDTSQYNRWVLRVTADGVSCNVGWRFSDGEDFRVAGGDTFGRVTFPPSDPDLFIFPGESGSVLGLQARVICRVIPGLGNDPGTTEPSMGTLSDVKILLRRD